MPNALIGVMHHHRFGDLMGRPSLIQNYMLADDFSHLGKSQIPEQASPRLGMILSALQSFHLGNIMEEGSCFHGRLIQPFSLKDKLATQGKGQTMDLLTMLDDMFWNPVGLQESVTFAERRNHSTSI